VVQDELETGESTGDVHRRQARVPACLDRGLKWLEDSRGLDTLSASLRTVAQAGLPARARDLAHGVPLGHAVHPALAQLPLGFFTSATLLGTRSEHRGAARRLVIAGLVTSAPTAVTGLTDWSVGHEQQQRVGLVHAGLNGLGLALFALSLAASEDGRGRRLASVAGLGALSAAGFLGGHMAFRQALGANHVEHVPHRVSAGWAQLCSLSELPEGEPQQLMLGDQPLLVYRQAGRVQVLSDVCSHLSGPLHEGAVERGRITCPWNGSAFRLADGSVARGPATAPLPVFDVRIDGAAVYVRLPGAG